MIALARKLYAVAIVGDDEKKALAATLLVSLATVALLLGVVFGVVAVATAWPVVVVPLLIVAFVVAVVWLARYALR